MNVLRIFDIMTEHLKPEHLNDPSVTTFIQALTIELNFSDACKRAGVGETRGKGYFRQPDITRCIDAVRAEFKSSNQLKGDMYVKVLDDMIELDPIHIFDDLGMVKPLKDIPANIRRQIKKFKVKIEMIENQSTGQLEKTPTVYDVEFHDKTRAIELAGGDIDRFKKKHEHQHNHELGQNASQILLGSTVSRADERMKLLEARDVSKKESKP